MIADVKHIFVIQSLFDNDVKTGEDLYNDLIRRTIDNLPLKDQMSHRFINVTSKDQLIEYLNYIAFNASLMRQGLLIHFEVHGSADKQGLILNNYELITWAELVDSFRRINIASVNGLCLSLASCYGRYLFEGVDPNLKSPYSGYISASNEVLPEEIIQDFHDIFSELIYTKNLISAYQSVENNQTRFFYKDSKETFDEVMKLNIARKRLDLQYKADLLKGEIFEDALKNGLATQEDLELLVEEAFKDVFNRHKQAFEFDED